MCTFDDLQPSAERARVAARTVIAGTSCELASSLLALDLSQQGQTAEFVRGHYIQPGHCVSGANEHAWVKVGGLLIDPTRDQFGEEPDSVSFRGRYVQRQTKPASEDLVYKQLALQWRIPARQPSIRRVAEEYGLDAGELDLYATLTYTMSPVARG